MIIKSLRRKNHSFASLVRYIERKADSAHTIAHNFHIPVKSNPSMYIRAFEQNSKYLRKRKNGNVMYHELISEKYNPNMSFEQQRNAIYDVSQKYISKRASTQLAW